MKKLTTVIIGGGAAGMMCGALVDNSRNRSTLLLEKMEKPLRKVRITGKGRCNLTNNFPTDKFLTKVRSGVEFIEPALNSFSTADCIAYFEKIGLPLTVERGGRVFPTSMKAQDVANRLEKAVQRNKTEIMCHAQVVEVVKKESQSGYIVTYQQKNREYSVECDNLVVATGGISYPSTGSTGDGYRFAYEMGHNIEPIRPSLVPLKIECKNLRELDRLVIKNISLELLIDGEKIGSEFGELEFFEYGIGGAIVLRVSRMAVDALIDQKRVEIKIDIKPALSEQKLLGRFTRECDADRALTVQSLMRKLMPLNLGKVVLSRLRFKPTDRVAQLSEADRKEIIAVVKALKFTVTDYGKFDKAIVTAGGVDLSQVDPHTMQSTIHSGLYIVGELLDMDADTGGFNLQLAFSSAFQAAKSINK